MARDGEDEGFEAGLLAAWRRMIAEDLPAVARDRGWPVASPAGLERLLLGHARGDSAHACASSRPADTLDLVFALELGARALEGRSCLAAVRRASLRRGAAVDEDPT